MKRFFQCHHDVGLDVASALRFATALAEIATTKARLAAPAKKGLEEIAEARPTEFEIDPATIGRRGSAESAAGSRPPSRRWLEPAPRLVPICPELVILLPFLRISQNLVGFVDLFELFFRRLFVLRDIGMMLPREPPKRFLYLVIVRRFGNAERLVIISKLNCHLSAGKVCA